MIFTIIIILFIIMVIFGTKMLNKEKKYEKNVARLNRGMGGIKKGISRREVHSLLPNYQFSSFSNSDVYELKGTFRSARLTIYYFDDIVDDIDFTVTALDK